MAVIQMIQMLIPLGIEDVQADFQAEVCRLFLGEQKVAIKILRVRNVETNSEVPSACYQKFRDRYHSMV